MGREGERTITQVDESGSDPRAPRSSGLVTYLPTYEGLKAFHSRLYFRPVNRVPLPLLRETAAQKGLRLEWNSTGQRTIEASSRGLSLVRHW